MSRIQSDSAALNSTMGAVIGIPPETLRPDIDLSSFQLHSKVLGALELLSPGESLSNRRAAAEWLNGNARNLDRVPSPAARAIFGAVKEIESEIVANLIGMCARNPALQQGTIPLIAYALRDDRAAVRRAAYGAITELGSEAAPLAFPLAVSIIELKGIASQAQASAAMNTLEQQCPAQCEGAARTIVRLQRSGMEQAGLMLAKDRRAIAGGDFEIVDDAFRFALAALMLGSDPVRHAALANLTEMREVLSLAQLQSMEASVAGLLRQLELGRDPHEKAFLTLLLYSASSQSPLAEWFAQQPLIEGDGAQLDRDLCALQLSAGDPPAAIVSRIGAEILATSSSLQSHALVKLQKLSIWFSETARGQLIGGMLAALERSPFVSGDLECMLQFLAAIEGHGEHVVRWAEERYSAPFDENSAQFIALTAFFGCAKSPRLEVRVRTLLESLRARVREGLQSEIDGYLDFLSYNRD